MVKSFHVGVCVTLAILIILSIYSIYIVHYPPLYITKKFSHCSGNCTVTEKIVIKKGDNIDNYFQPLDVSYLELTESVMYISR